MSADIAVVLDATALTAYVEGRVAVGELVAEVADEGRQIGVPAVCLAAAQANARSDIDAALLRLLMATPVVRLLPLSGNDAEETGVLARAAGADLAVGHAAQVALAHEAHYVTTRPAEAAKALPTNWSILTLD